MAKKPDQNSKAEHDLTRVIADFGGRRKILDRRRNQTPNKGRERRSGEDRRSGFDRRGAMTQNSDNKPEKRKDFKNQKLEDAQTEYHVETN